MPEGDSEHRRKQDHAGATPLDSEETEDLIPGHLQTQVELNQWEALNIADATRWALRRRDVDVLSPAALKELHLHMFGQTWRWAGTFRQSDKNLSPYRWTQIPELIENLVANTLVRYESSDKSAETIDEIALRFHHELVRIYPWPNGNGRHARLATDLLLQSWGRPPFTWSRGDLGSDGDLRARYISALRSADERDYALLRQFVRT